MTITLRENQARGAAVIIDRPRYGFEHDCGTGKTIMGLAGIRGFGKGKWVVVCPLSVIETAWMRDAKAMNFVSIRSLAGLPVGERARLIRETTAGVLVINFDIYAKHVEDFIRCGWRKLVVDEASRMKNFKAVQCRAILRHAEVCERFYWLSGTPAPNGEHEYWAVLRATAPEQVSASPYQFYSKYFITTYKKIRIKGCKGKERRVTDSMELREDRKEEFHRLLASCLWKLRQSDCMDLPPEQDSVREVSLSGPEQHAYDEAKNELRLLLRGGLRSVRLKAQVLVHKLRQLAGGWAYSGEEDAGGGAAEHGSSKISELTGILEELGRNPSIIWIDFKHDARRVRELLDSMGKRSRMLVGGGDDAAASVAAFQDGSVDSLVCHPQSVGHGVTMTRASHAVYYTLPWSWEYYHQSRKRIHRFTQTAACTYHLLLAKGTVDHAVHRSLENKHKKHDELAAVLAEMGMNAGTEADDGDDQRDGSGGAVPVGAVRAD